ncbi:hypothetical protein FJZ17_03100 [Candidatus Pacearchaeota archaeon]|nr:hypothetical protein [Candidatus Pacearchaeota archaeon]
MNMVDERMKKLAQMVVNYCLGVKKGDKILIDSSTEAEDFIEECYKQILLKRGIPIYHLYSKHHKEIILRYGNKKQLKFFPHHLLEEDKRTVGVIDIENESSELSNISKEKMRVYNHTMKPYFDYIIYSRNNYKRITLLVPSKKHAEEAGMSLKEFEDFIYEGCLLNWEEIAKKFSKVKEAFEKASEVSLIGKNVDLKFSIKGRNCIMEAGKENLPGGEIFMAPIKNSLNGWIKFEYPAIRDGLKMSGVYLKFKKGKIVEYGAKRGINALKALIETDEGSRYIGEFGVGINPKIKKATNSWIDEKIDGTIHLAIGKSYEENYGDNDSAVHFDIVKDMHEGKIILDGKVVQENGKWKI